MQADRKARLEELKQKFLSMLSDEELERQCRKCPNRWVWSAVELEMARREAEEYVEFFNLKSALDDYRKNGAVEIPKEACENEETFFTWLQASSPDL